MVFSRYFIVLLIYNQLYSSKNTSAFFSISHWSARSSIRLFQITRQCFYSQGILFWPLVGISNYILSKASVCVLMIFDDMTFLPLPQFTELCKNTVSFHSDQFSHWNTWRKQKQHIPLHCFCHWNFTFIIKLDLLLVSLIIFCFVDLIQHLWAKQYSCLSCQGFTISWKSNMLKIA